MKHVWTYSSAFAILVALILSAPETLAQAPDAEAGAADEPPSEVEIEVESEDLEINAAPTPAPTPAPAAAPVAVPPAPSTASEPPPSAVALTVTAEPASEQAAPATDEALAAPQATPETPLLPRELVLEGSNYTRPLPLGLRWSGFVQAELHINQISEDQLDANGEALNRDAIGVRRGRLRVDHGWEYAFATLEIEANTFAAPNLGVRRAEASLLYRGGVPDSKAPLLVLTAGLTDVPFGAELGESQRDRLFVERSIGSIALFPTNADAGIKLWGAHEFVNYAIAVVNGEPVSGAELPKDPNAHKDVTGRAGIDTTLGSNARVTAGSSFYVGRGTSLGRLSSKDLLEWVDFNNNGRAEPDEVVGVAAISAVQSQQYTRWALGLDASFALRTPLGVSQLEVEAFYASNLDRGVLPIDPITAGSSRQLAWMVGFVQQVSRWVAVGIRLADYDPNSNVIEERAGAFHLRDQSYWVLSPVASFTLPGARATLQYDIVQDHLGRDERGVPADVANNQLTARLQVDL